MSNKARLYSGRCLVCGMLFFGMLEEELDSTASRHIWEEHRDQNADDVIVKVDPCE